MKAKRTSRLSGRLVAVSFSLITVASWFSAAMGGVGHNFGIGAIGFGIGLGAAGGSFFNNVGGVSIDADGVLRDVRREASEEVKKDRDKFKTKVPLGLEKKVELRKFSLAQMMKEMWKIRAADIGPRTLPEEFRYMGGLQRVQYVFVYPEDQDIVLAGPAEGWRVDELGQVVGQTTGQPVLHITDFLEALRAVMKPNPQPMTCSIDPTPEGVAQMNAVAASLGSVQPSQVKKVAQRLEEALGMQTVKFEGLDPKTSFAWVMVAADYRMKCLAMGFEKSPVKGMPSYLQMIGNKRPENIMPRWWMEPNYEALLTDENGLAWELRGQGVRCMTEDEVVADDGTRRGTGKVDPLAKKWADTMTEKFEELSEHVTPLRHLRNCMDLVVVAALISQEQLHTKAGLDLNILTHPDILTVNKLAAPQSVPSQVSFERKGRAYVMTVSGGVSIDPWQVARKQEKTDKLDGPREDAIAPAAAEWWWN